MFKLRGGKARKDLAKAISRVRDGERFFITRHGEKVAAIVSVEDLKFLRSYEDYEDIRAVEASREDIKINGTIPWEQLKAELGLSTNGDRNGRTKVQD